MVFSLQPDPEQLYSFKNGWSAVYDAAQVVYLLSRRASSRGMLPFARPRPRTPVKVVVLQKIEDGEDAAAATAAATSSAASSDAKCQSAEKLEDSQSQQSAESPDALCLISVPVVRDGPSVSSTSEASVQSGQALPRENEDAVRVALPGSCSSSSASLQDHLQPDADPPSKQDGWQVEAVQQLWLAPDHVTQLREELQACLSREAAITTALLAFDDFADLKSGLDGKCGPDQHEEVMQRLQRLAEDYERLKAANVKLSEAHEQLQQVEFELQEANVKSTAANVQLAASLSHLEEVNLQLQESAWQAEETNRGLVAELEARGQVVEQLKEANSSLKEANSSLAAEVEGLQQANRWLQAAAEHLQEGDEKLQTRHGELESRSQQVGVGSRQLEEANRKLQQTNLALTTAVVALGAADQQLGCSNDVVKQENELLKHRDESYTKQMKDLQDRNETLVQTIQDLQGVISTLSEKANALEASPGSWNETVVTQDNLLLKQDLQDLNCADDRLLTAHQIVQDEVRQLQIANQQLEEANEQLQPKVTSLQQLEAANEQLRLKVTSLQQLEAANEQLQLKVTSLQQAPDKGLEVSMKQMDHKQHLQDTCETLQRLNAELLSSNGQSKKERTQLRNRNHELEVAAMKLQEAVYHLHQTEEHEMRHVQHCAFHELDTLYSQLQQAHAHNRALQGSLEELKSSVVQPQAFTSELGHQNPGHQNRGLLERNIGLKEQVMQDKQQLQGLEPCSLDSAHEVDQQHPDVGGRDELQASERVLPVQALQAIEWALPMQTSSSNAMEVVQKVLKENEQLVTQVQELEVVNRRLSDAHSQAQHESEGLGRENQQLQEDNAQLTRQHEELQQAHEQVTEQHAQLQEANAHLTSQHEELQQAHEQVMEQHVQLQEANVQLQEANAQLTSQHEELQQAHEQVTEQHAQLLEANVQLQEANAQLTSQHEELQQAHQQVTEQHAQLQEGNAQLTSQHEELQQAHEQVMEQHAQLQEADAHLTSQHEELQQAHQQVTEQHAQLQEANAHLTSQHEELQQAHQQVTEQHAQLEAANVQLQEANVQLQDANAQLTGQNEELQQAHQQVTEQHAQLTSQHEELQQARQQVTEQHAQLTGQHEELQQAHQQVTEQHVQLLKVNEGLQQGYEVMTQQHLRLQGVHAGGRQTIEELKQANTELQEANVQLDSKKYKLQDTVAQLSDVILELQEDAKQTAAEREELQGAAAQQLLLQERALQESDAEWEVRCRELEATNTHLSERNQELETSNTQLRERNQELEATHTQLSERNQELETSNTQLSERNQELEVTNTQLSERNQKLEVTSTQLSERNQKLEVPSTQLSEKNQKLEVTSTQPRERNQDLNASCDETTLARLASYEQQLSAAEHQHERLKQAVQQLEEDKIALMEANEQLQSRNDELQEMWQSSDAADSTTGISERDARHVDTDCDAPGSRSAFTPPDDTHLTKAVRSVVASAAKHSTARVLPLTTAPQAASADNVDGRQNGADTQEAAMELMLADCACGASSDDLSATWRMDNGSAQNQLSRRDLQGLSTRSVDAVEGNGEGSQVDVDMWNEQLAELLEGEQRSPEDKEHLLSQLQQLQTELDSGSRLLQAENQELIDSIEQLQADLQKLEEDNALLRQEKALLSSAAGELQLRLQLQRHVGNMLEPSAGQAGVLGTHVLNTSGDVHVQQAVHDAGCVVECGTVALDAGQGLLSDKQSVACSGACHASGVVCHEGDVTFLPTAGCNENVALASAPPQCTEETITFTSASTQYGEGVAFMSGSAGHSEEEGTPFMYATAQHIEKEVSIISAPAEHNNEDVTIMSASASSREAVLIQPALQHLPKELHMPLPNEQYLQELSDTSLVKYGGKDQPSPTMKIQSMIEQLQLQHAETKTHRQQVVQSRWKLLVSRAQAVRHMPTTSIMKSHSTEGESIGGNFIDSDTRVLEAKVTSPARNVIVGDTRVDAEVVHASIGEVEITPIDDEASDLVSSKDYLTLGDKTVSNTKCETAFVGSCYPVAIAGCSTCEWGPCPDNRLSCAAVDEGEEDQLLSSPSLAMPLSPLPSPSVPTTVHQDGPLPAEQRSTGAAISLSSLITAPVLGPIKTMHSSSQSRSQPTTPCFTHACSPLHTHPRPPHSHAGIITPTSPLSPFQRVHTISCPVSPSQQLMLEAVLSRTERLGMLSTSVELQPWESSISTNSTAPFASTSTHKLHSHHHHTFATRHHHHGAGPHTLSPTDEDGHGTSHSDHVVVPPQVTTENAVELTTPDDAGHEPLHSTQHAPHQRVTRSEKAVQAECAAIGSPVKSPSKSRQHRVQALDGSGVDTAGGADSSTGGSSNIDVENQRYGQDYDGLPFAGTIFGYCSEGHLSVLGPRLAVCHWVEPEVEDSGEEARGEDGRGEEEGQAEVAVRAESEVAGMGTATAAEQQGCRVSAWVEQAASSANPDHILPSIAEDTSAAASAPIITPPLQHSPEPTFKHLDRSLAHPNPSSQHTSNALRSSPLNPHPMSLPLNPHAAPLPTQSHPPPVRLLKRLFHSDAFVQRGHSVSSSLPPDSSDTGSIQSGYSSLRYSGSSVRHSMEGGRGVGGGRTHPAFGALARLEAEMTCASGILDTEMSTFLVDASSLDAAELAEVQSELKRLRMTFTYWKRGYKAKLKTADAGLKKLAGKKSFGVRFRKTFNLRGSNPSDSPRSKTFTSTRSEPPASPSHSMSIASSRGGANRKLFSMKLFQGQS